jgi:drug/metabolite transporter (DMT)-like permease
MRKSAAGYFRFFRSESWRLQPQGFPLSDRLAHGNCFNYNGLVPSSVAPAEDRLLPVIDPYLSGVVCGLVAALGYTASNVCLRSAAHCDPLFVSFVKAIPTVVLVGPVLLWRMMKGQGILTSPRALFWLLLAGLVGQLCGNVVFQWSLGIVGMGLTVALCFGTMISSAAALGWWILGERLTRRMVVASSVLVLSIIVLSLGASAAQKSVAGVAIPTAWWQLMAGIAGPCLSGVAYAVLNISIRHSGRIGTPVVTILALVGLVGCLSLGTISFVRLGWEAMRQTEQRDFLMMLGAGIFNALAFGALAKALHLTNVMVANGLNASQTAMAALAGIVFFDEAITWTLIVGVLLTMLGLILMKGRAKSTKLPHVPEIPLAADGLPVSELAMPECGNLDSPAEARLP